MPEKPFFPNVPLSSLQIEGQLRALAQGLDEASRNTVYEVLSKAHEHFRPTEFELRKDTLVAKQLSEEIVFPRPLPMVKFSHILSGYRTWLEHKYALPGFVSVEQDDIVVDCGAYVGGFSLSAVERAQELHAFEPEPRNFACLSANIGKHPNAFLNELGAYSSTQTMTLNISASSVEHSLLTPDDGASIAQREIQVIALSDYCAQRSVQRIDFLKLEAEGVELEIFEGLGDIRPRKLAIDVSPEREGQSPAEEFKVLLAPLGYEFRQRANVLFARLHS